MIKKYYIKTFGCQMNESDSERIAGFLENKGYKNASKIEEANLIIVNACSVRQTAVDRVLGLKAKFKKLKAKKILTGCFLKSDIKKFEKYFDEILTIKELLNKNYLSLVPKNLHSSSAFVPIMTGCNNFCSYCVVPYTRGREISRPAKEIINEIKNLISKNYKEIVLLGQNVNSYKDKDLNFSDLLKMINKTTGKFIIKFLTNHPKDFSDELINTIANCKKIAKEIHLPVQSGDDEILKKMNRKYTAKQYLNLVEKINHACRQAGNKIPDIKLSTDIIVGFPGETKKQFENTVNLVKRLNFNIAYINKYSPRVGTSAFKLKDDISWEEKKHRWKILNNLINQSDQSKIKNLIVVLGPTASGKSDLAVKIAKQYNGEIISTDSKQIYKGMNIGTGKINKKEMQKIPHYMIDIASPKKQFTIAQHKNKTLKIINEIRKKNKIPILCGGTGFYIQAIAENLNIPQIKPDKNLRKELDKKTTEQLLEELKKLAPQRAKTIDTKNKRRLIRAIEIIKKTNNPVPFSQFSAKGGSTTSQKVLYIGIKKYLPELKKTIDKRVNKMIKIGLEKEVKKLVKEYGWTQVLKNTIGYAEWKNYNDKKQIAEMIKLHTLQFAKKQITWFKKYPGNKINWVKNYPQVKKLVKDFLD